MKLVIEATPIIEETTKSQIIFLDTETSSLQPWVNDQVLAGIGIKVLGGKSFYLPYRHTVSIDSENADEKELHKLGAALQGKTIVMHNAKFDAAVLWQENINIIDETDVLDTIVLMRLISEDESNYKLKSLAKKYLDPNANEGEKELKKYMKEHELETYDLVPAKEILDYVEHDLLYTEGLYKLALPIIKSRGLVDLLDDEKKATKALFHMEREGFTSNRGWVKRNKSKIKKQSNILKLECYGDIGTALVKRGKEWANLTTKEQEDWSIAWDLYRTYNLNIQSTQQLGVLFHGLGIHSPKKIKTGESWDKYVLADLAKEYPIADLVVRYRTVSGIEDYYDDFLERMDINNIIHCSIKQAGAKSGRYACAQPNLQNIPTPNSPAALDLSEEERELLFEVRGAFIPSE